MDALTAFFAGGFGGWVAHALAEGKPVPTEAQILKDLESLKPKLTKNVAIDTTTARNNETYPIAGQSLNVENPATPSASVYIRLNEPDADQIDLTKQGKIKAPFYRFFITNDAGTGTLNLIVNKASVLDLTGAVTDVNIVAQTISNLLMTFNAQNVGVYLQPEWTVTQGQDKVFTMSLTNKTFGYTGSDSYVIPSGKILRICYMSFSLGPTRTASATDADAPQHAEIVIYHSGLGAFLPLGGDGGNSMIINPPLELVYGETATFYATVLANHYVDIYAAFGGYEIDA